MAYLFKKLFSMLSTVCIIATLGLVSNVAIANTPDGETPANEGVCDSVIDGTKGLYGLCVAYCEAQDLDEIGDKETPNNKILGNYRKKMQAGDLDMPCIKPVCPCWTAEELAGATENAITNNACTISDTVAILRNSGPTQFAYASTSAKLCRFTDRSVIPAISVRFTIDTVEKAQVCYDQVVAACATLPAP